MAKLRLLVASLLIMALLCVTLPIIASAQTPVPPTVVTNAATSVTSNSAILNGNLTSIGTANAVLVSFQWGLKRSYGTETAAMSYTAPGPFSMPISGLTPGKTYHFRATVVVGDITIYGKDMKFRCPRN